MKMAAWLLKSEPDTFSIDALARSPGQKTLWDGVRNFQARNYLLAMQVGERAFFYHSSCPNPGIVGEMVVVAKATPDPTQFDPQSPYYDAKSTREKPRWFAPELKLVRKYPVVFSRKAMAKTALAQSLLFTHSRLSVMPLSPAAVAAIERWLSSL